VLNGFDIDLAADLTRRTNRLWDSLVGISAVVVAVQRCARRLAGGSRPDEDVAGAHRL
jgi:hypothetical protein